MKKSAVILFGFSALALGSGAPDCSADDSCAAQFDSDAAEEMKVSLLQARTRQASVVDANVDVEVQEQQPSAPTSAPGEEAATGTADEEDKYSSYDSYTVYYNKNAYEGYGAVNLDHDGSAPALSAQGCKDRCSARSDCMCVTQETSTGQCWMRTACDPSGWNSPYNNGHNVYMENNYYYRPTLGGPRRRYNSGGGSYYSYTTYYNKNAYSGYGAIDIDFDGSANNLSPQQCKDRCSARSDCMCVTQETSTGKCWMRAACDPSGWTSPYNVGHNVFMKNYR
eukprot:TRINITY_DN12728_c0_g1_i1.p1 TRINITY_DN12728_c0_g1~~TRINITY_DN12728_c0_g1_i1.p1  ORF type:complete len:281 (-),score=50.92 TRINITY_DN12728_c0_g1_i1:384-1226(-)